MHRRLWRSETRDKMRLAAIPARAAGFAALIAALAMVASAWARDRDSIAGLYRCERGCRVTDAAPAIAIDQNSAACTNELGGIFYGARLSRRSVACFNKIGTLSSDGALVL
jgi:hypothetical protein